MSIVTKLRVLVLCLFYFTDNPIISLKAKSYTRSKYPLAPPWVFA